MSEVLGSVLLVGLAVIMGTGFTLVLFGVPPPAPGSALTLEAFVSPAAPDTVVVEHRGGPGVPLRQLGVNLRVEGEVVAANVGAALDAGEAAWKALGPGGSPKAASEDFGPGDQVRYTSAAVRGARIGVAVFDGQAGQVVLGPLETQPGDRTPPRLVAARTTGPLSLELTFDESLHALDRSDLGLTLGLFLASADLVGNGTRAEATTTAVIAAGVLPVVSTVAAPLGTMDLGANALVGSLAVPATDGAPPLITSGPVVIVSGTTATVRWTTDEPSDSRVAFGPTPALGRAVSDAALVTSHAVTLTGLGQGTLFNYTVGSADAAGNRNTTGPLSFTSAPPAVGNNPTFSGPVVNIIYPSTEAKDAAAKVGVNIINPTAGPIVVDRVRLTASPPLGAGADAKFFRGLLTSGAGSDVDMACAWTGAGSDTATCDPVLPVVVPGKGLKQVVLQFTTAKDGADAHTILTAEVLLTAPATTITTAHNVRHQPSGLHFDLLALGGPAGLPRAGHAPAASGAPVDFHYQWSVVAGDAKLRTRFIIPAGWSSLLVPSQAALTDLALHVRQPTPTSQGYVDVGQDLTAGSREFYFRVTPPPGAEALVMQVDFEGSKEGSSKLSFANLMWFGVSLA